jgi:hypothetical protein
MDTDLDVRPSPIAGQWYPGDARRLSASIDGYLNAAVLPPLAGQVGLAVLVEVRDGFADG